MKTETQDIELPTINLPGGPRTLRRLGIYDYFAISSLINKPLQIWLNRRAASLTNVDLLSPEGLLSFATIALQNPSEEMYEWLASLLGLTQAEVRDPEVVPFPVLPELVVAIAKHPDVSKFQKYIVGVVMGFRAKMAEFKEG